MHEIVAGGCTRSAAQRIAGHLPAARRHHAAITGDFVLTAAEVTPVMRTLRESGIDVTALHNHMLDDQPRMFFMHFWANDDAAKLARGLRAALDKVNIKKQIAAK